MSRDVAYNDMWQQFARTASGMSTCSRRQVGAVAVREKRLLATGFNGNLPGTMHCVDGGCERCADTATPSGTQLERCVCVHAEQNLVAYAAKVGAPLHDAVVWCTHRPCHDCFKLLVSAGVERIVFLETYPANYPVPASVEMMLYVDGELVHE